MKKAMVIALVILSAVPLVIGVTALPRKGSPDAPPHTHVAPRYLAQGTEEAGSKNIVAAVLLNYRALDTAGEVTVIFTGFAAALAVLIIRSVTATRLSTPAAPPLSPVTSFVVRLITPFTALFAIYVVGDFNVAPGGGFQGGAILGGMLITLMIVLGENRILPHLHTPAARWLQAIGLLAFALVGVFGAVAFGHFLEFPIDPAMAAVRKTMLTVLEFAIGIAGAAIFSTIFLQMEAHE